MYKRFGLWILLSWPLFLSGQAEATLFTRPEAYQREWEKQLAADDLAALAADCREVIAEMPSERKKGLAHYYLAAVHFRSDQLDSARTSLLSAAAYFQKSTFDEGYAIAHNKLGQIDFYQLNLSAAAGHYHRALWIARKRNLWPLAYTLKQNLAVLHGSLGRQDSVTQCLKEALEVARRLNSDEKTKATTNQLSTHYYSNGQLDSAITYFEQLLSLKKAEQDAASQISDLGTLGRLYQERGNYLNAQQHFIDALRLAENQRDTFFIMSLCANISGTYAAQQLYPSAKKYARRAMQLAAAKKVRQTEAQSLKTLAACLQQEDSTEAALRHYRAALAIYRQLNNPINAADVQIELSKLLYQRKDDYQAARGLINEAIAARQGAEDPIGLLTAQLVLGEIELRDGQPGRAVQLLRQCLADATAMDHQNARRRALGLLAEAYAQQGNYRHAFDYFRAYSSLNDSIASIEKSRAINELEVLYETEKKDKALIEHKAEIEHKANRIRRQNYQQALTLGALAVFGLLVGFLFYVNRKNRQLNQQKIEVLKKQQETQRLKAIIQGEEKERRRIARDLHDGLGALLATTKMRINALENDAPQIKQLPSYCKAEELIDEACRTIREISHNMVPTVLNQHGLEYALNDLCQSVAHAHNIRVDFLPFDLNEDLDVTLKVSIYRMVQELLRNVIKHARATEVIVQLTMESEHITLIVEDDGRGFDPSRVNGHNGIGLENIRSRVEYLEGNMEIESNREEGSTFTIDLPLQTPTL